MSYPMVNDFLFGYGTPLAILLCSIIFMMKLENTMKTLLIYLMNTLLKPVKKLAAPRSFTDLKADL